MSATRAHTPANIHDTHVKWSGARGYIHSRADLSCARAHTYTHRHTHPKKRSGWRNKTQQLYWPLSRVLLVGKKKGNNSRVQFNNFGNVSSPLSHATMHKSVYVNRVVDKNQTR